MAKLIRVILIREKEFRLKYFLDENNELYKKNLDKWSFPFNGGENYGVNSWLKKIDKYKPFIHDIYMSAPPR